MWSCLERLGEKITASLSVEKIISTVYDNVNSLMDASVFGIGIYNDVLKRVEFPATYEKGEPLSFTRILFMTRTGLMLYVSGLEMKS